MAEPAVELRLGKIGRRLAKNSFAWRSSRLSRSSAWRRRRSSVVGPALCPGHTQSAEPKVAASPPCSRSSPRSTDRRPFRCVLALMLLHRPNRRPEASGGELLLVVFLVSIAPSSQELGSSSKQKQLTVGGALGFGLGLVAVAAPSPPSSSGEGAFRRQEDQEKLFRDDFAGFEGSRRFPSLHL